MKATLDFSNLYAVFGTFILRDYKPFKRSTQLRDVNTQVNLVMTIQRFVNRIGYIGGEVEKDEYWLDALIREMWEEALIEPWMLQSLACLTDDIFAIAHENDDKKIGFVWIEYSNENPEQVSRFFELFDHIHNEVRYSDEVFGVSLTPVYKDKEYVNYNNNLLNLAGTNKFALVETVNLLYPNVTDTQYPLDDIVIEPVKINRWEIIEACDRVAVNHS